MESRDRSVSGGEAAARSAEEQVQVAPPPLWVVHAPFEPGGETDEKFVSNGVCLLLRDHQVDCTGPTVAYHSRMFWRVLTPAGAAAVAQFSVAFDPLLQHLDIHAVRVHRGGEVLDHTRRDTFTLMRREQNLERHVLDGHVTVSNIVPDVRPGDIVENSWTIYERQTVLGDRISVFATLLAPAMELRERLRVPAQRKIALKYFGEPLEPVVQEIDGVTDYAWTVSRNEPEKREDFTPPWVVTARGLQAGDITDWPEVSRLFAPHYEPHDIPEPLKAEAQRITEATGDPETRMMAVLQAVQTRLRYLSMSLGEGGFVPRPLADIWDTGYGDCKESSVLFVALARLCGLEAAAALISTGRGAALKEFLPNAAVFDHCIARVTIAGKRYWIDPTRRYQPGNAALLSNNLLGFALPITPEGADLEEMGIPRPRVFRDVHEVVTFGDKVSSSATLSLRMTFGSIAAESVREMLANQGLPAVAEQIRNRYVNEWPRLTDIEPLTAETNDGDGTITLQGRYTIAQPWTEGEGKRVCARLVDHNIAGELGSLAKTDARQTEIYLGIPRIVRRNVEVTMPKTWNVGEVDNTFDIEGAVYTDKIINIEPMKFAIEQQLVVSAPVSPKGEATGYADLTRAMNDRPTFVLSSPFFSDTFGTPPDRKELHWNKTVNWIVLGCVILWALFRLLTVNTDQTPPTVPGYQIDESSRPSPEPPPPSHAAEPSPASAQPTPSSDLHVKDLDWMRRQTGSGPAAAQPDKTQQHPAKQPD